MTAKKITAQFFSKCAICGETIEQKETVWYDADAPRGKKVWHVDCEHSETREYHRRMVELRKEDYERAESQIAAFGTVREGATVRALREYKSSSMSWQPPFVVKPGTLGTVRRTTVGIAGTTYHGVSWQVGWDLGGGYIGYVDVYPNVGQIEVVSE